MEVLHEFHWLPCPYSICFPHLSSRSAPPHPLSLISPTLSCSNTNLPIHILSIWFSVLYMCSCLFSWIISLARSSRLSANFLCALAATADFSSEHWMFLVSPFGQKEQWLTDLCCPLTDMISRWNHQLQLSKVHQNAILLAVSRETLDDKVAGRPIRLQMDKLSATSHRRWTNQI